MKIFIFITLFIISQTGMLYATNQLGDRLLWQGDTLMLYSNPLGLHSNNEGILRSIAIELEREDKRLHPERYNDKMVEVISSTGCNRGYFAEWLLDGDKIFLNAIYACCDTTVKVSLSKIFPEALVDKPLFASWITGSLNVVNGDCILLMNIDYESIFEKEIVLEFTNGVLINTKMYDNSIIRQSKYTTNPNPNVLMDSIYSRIKWEQLPVINNNKLLTIISIHPKYDGTIDSICWDKSFLLDGQNVISDRNNVFIKEALRVISLIDDWDVVIKQDRIMDWMVSVLFSSEMKEKYKKD